MSKSANKTAEKNIIWYFIGLAVLFLVGLLVLLYPAISNAWNEHLQRRITANYTEQIKAIKLEEKDDIFDKAVEYNKTLTKLYVPDAFLQTDFDPNPEYMKLLNPTGDEYMGNIDIPAIDVNIPIYHYSSKEVLEHGAGHLPGSSLPVGGENTHCVISAHRGLPTAKLFTDLDRLKEGNQFYLHVLDHTLAYEVDKITVVEPDDTKDLAIEKGMDLCTLLTCTPYAVNTHRLLVRGHRVENEKGQANVTAEAIQFEPVIMAPLIAAPLLLILIIWLFIFTGKRAKHKDALREQRERLLDEEEINEVKKH